MRKGFLQSNNAYCLSVHIAVMVALGLCLTLTACAGIQPQSLLPTKEDSIVGKNFDFGGYTWRVLDAEGGQAFIVTENLPEVRRFDESTNEWASSEIRQYLNGDFLKGFSPEEQELIYEVSLPDVGTTDKVFLLSVDEVQSYFYGPEDCRAEFTGTDRHTEMGIDIERWWWLRTPGENDVGVAVACSDGILYPQENDVFFVYYGMRPAMVVQLSALQESSASDTSEPSTPQAPDEPQEPTEPPAPPAPSEPQIPEGAIDWTEAGQHVGEVVTVYGTVARATYASTSTGQPTFIDVGASYPDTSRVSLAIWGQYRGNFPEPPEDMYLGKTICVTGEVYVYSGACNIEVYSPDQIQVIE